MMCLGWLALVLASCLVDHAQGSSYVIQVMNMTNKNAVPVDQELQEVPDPLILTENSMQLSAGNVAAISHSPPLLATSVPLGTGTQDQSTAFPTDQMSDFLTSNEPSSMDTEIRDRRTAIAPGQIMDSIMNTEVRDRRTAISTAEILDSLTGTTDRDRRTAITVDSGNPTCAQLLPPGLVEEIRGYQGTVDQIIDYVVHGPHKGRTYDTLSMLVDIFGPRVSGTAALEEAIDWMLEKSRTEGLENVHTEEVMVPHWVRNEESAWLREPRVQQLNILGLGSSVATPPEGITAQVLVVTDFEDLEKHANQVKGKIVVYNPMWESYPKTVQYRSQGASRAARLGAVAALVRTVAPFSIDSPHTGQQYYDSEETKIPVACITVEDAAMLGRLQKRGIRLTIQLTMNALTYPEALSRNTIAEVLGSELPEEAVVVSGHLDSWDVGQGAMDDGGGAMISWEAGVVLRRLGLRPRRTLRTILWTGEEQGLYGGAKYYENHQQESDRFQLIMESDRGTFTPQGLGYAGTEEGTCVMQEVMKLLHSINATKVDKSGGGPDIGFWKKKGVPLGALLNANDRYFWFHHSAGDTLSVVDPDVLDLCLALWTSVAYVAADMSYKLPRVPVQQ